MYNKILVAIDFSDSSPMVIERALELAGDAAKLQLVHGVEPIPTVWGMESYAMDPTELQEKILASAGESLAELAGKFGLKDDQQHIVLGSPATEIRVLQEKLGADAIVIGSHGHAVWKLILGSTANKLLHGAKCDVLTVFVGKD